MAFLEAYNVEGELNATPLNNTTLSITGETRTPIAAIFQFSNCAAYGAETANEVFAIAFCTGTPGESNHVVAWNSIYSGDGAGTSEVYGIQNIDSAGSAYQIALKDDAGTMFLQPRTAQDNDARGPIAGGWVITTNVNSLGAVKVVGTLFFGEGRGAEIVTVPASEGEGTYSLTTTVQGDVGFWIAREAGGAGTSGTIGLGYHAGIEQASFIRWQEDGVDTTALKAYVSDEVCSVDLSDVERTHYAISAVNPTSLEFNITTPVGAVTRGIHGLIFDLDPAQSAYVGVDAGFLSGGVDDYAISTGFRPAWLQGVFTNIPLGSEDTEISNANASTLSIMSMDALGVGHSLAAASKDDVETTDTKTKVRHNTGGGQWFSGYVNSTSADSHAAYSYTGVPFVSDGLALRAGEYTDPDFATARAWPVFALQAATPTFTGYSSSLKLLLDASNRSATSTEVNGEAGVTFTATGGAGRTYWDADGVLQTTTGNELAWNTDPVTGVVGLQSHAAYQNEIQDSEDVEGTGWTTQGTPETPIAATGPDGAAGSLHVLEDGSATRDYYSHARAGIAAASETWTAKCIVKKDAVVATTRFASLRIEFIGGAAERFHLGLDTSTGEVATDDIGTGAGTIVSGSANLVQNTHGDFWDVSLVCTNSSDASNTQVQIRVYPAYGQSANLTTGNDATLGAATMGMFQLTKSPMPLPYFKTTGTAAGPSADIPQMDTDFSWYNTLGGTFAFDFTMPDGDNPTSSRVFNVSDGGTSDYWDTNTAASGSLQTKIFSGSVSQVSKTSDVNAEIGGRFRVATAATNADGYRTAINGFFDAAVSSPTMPVGLSEINLGARHGESLPSWLMYLHSLRYYDTRIPDGGPQAGEDDLSLYNLSMGLVNESAAAGTRSSGSMGRRRRLGAIWKR